MSRLLRRGGRRRGGGAVAAADVFVATTGNDTTGNGTFALPYKTLAKGITAADTLTHSSGTQKVVELAAGTYTDVSASPPYASALTAAPGGTRTSAKKITVRNAAGATVEIRGPQRIGASWDWLHFKATSRGLFIFNGWAQTGVVFTEPTFWLYGNDCTFEDLVILNNNPAAITGNTSEGSGFFFGQDDTKVCERPTVTGCVIRDIHWKGTGSQPHGIYASHCLNPTFTNNVFVGIKGVSEGSWAMQLYSKCNGAVVTNNTIDDCHGGVTQGTNVATNNAVTGDISTASPRLVANVSPAPNSSSIGRRITGTGIPAGTYILGLSGTTFTISQDVTATTVGLAMNYFKTSDGHQVTKNIASNMVGTQPAFKTLWADSTANSPPAGAIGITIDQNHVFSVAGGVSVGNGMTVTNGTTGDPLYSNQATRTFVPLGGASPALAGNGGRVATAGADHN